MSSPLTQLPGSSPFPFPTTMTEAPAPSPSPLSALLPQIASSTSGLGLTPGTNPFLALQPGQAQAGLGSGPGAGPAPGAAGGSVRSIATTTSTGGESVGLEGCLRSLDEAARMVERALEVQGELEGAKRGAFGVGEQPRIESLQLEYNQLITSLYLLSSTTLFGALPLPLSLPAEHPSVAELTGWCESRAALEFSRREGVKGGARVVLDILKGQAR